MQKVEVFLPEINKVYFMESHTLIHVLSGKGSIQVDFKNYFNWQQKAIFLDKGQYIKFLSDDFTVRRIEFSNANNFDSKQVRVLFKHLISLSHIHIKGSGEGHNFLSRTILTDNSVDILDTCSKQWYSQNPFKASNEEYQVIFDTKEIIDEEYCNNLSRMDLINYIKNQGYNEQSLLKKELDYLQQN